MYYTAQINSSLVHVRTYAHACAAHLGGRFKLKPKNLCIPCSLNSRRRRLEWDCVWIVFRRLFGTEYGSQVVSQDVQSRFYTVRFSVRTFKVYSTQSDFQSGRSKLILHSQIASQVSECSEDCVWNGRQFSFTKWWTWSASFTKWCISQQRLPDYPR